MIVGHKKITDFLEKQLAAGKTSQAYLFCGPEKVGKKTLALWLAEKLAGKSGQNINPDIMLIAPEAEEKKGVRKILDIKIEKIRELQHQISLYSASGGSRVFIVDNAEKLTRSAQNALLKILEEPNEKAVLILVSEDENRLLPTIVSRCQKIRFSLVSEKEMQKMISADVANREALLFWSFSRPGMLQDLLDDPEEMEFRKEAFSEFRALFASNLGERFELAKKISQDKERMLRKIDLWSALLRSSLLRLNAKIRISPLKSLRLLRTIDEKSRLLRETNVNSRAILENIFLEF